VLTALSYFGGLFKKQVGPPPGFFKKKKGFLNSPQFNHRGCVAKKGSMGLGDTEKLSEKGPTLCKKPLGAFPQIPRDPRILFGKRPPNRGLLWKNTRL